MENETVAATASAQGADVDGATAAGATHAAARRGFATHVAWTLGARVLMAANSILVGVVVARTLGAEGFGALAVLNLAVAYAVQIGNLGLASANTYFVARERRLLAPAAANSLAFAAVAGTLLALATVGLAYAAPQVLGDVRPRLVAVAALAVPFQLVTLFGLNLFLALGQVGRFNLIDAAAQTLLPLNALVALIILGAGLPLLIGLNTAASVAVSLAVAWLVARAVRRRGGEERRRLIDAGLFARMMRYGLKVHAQTVASLLLFRADLFVVKYFRGVREAGVYAVASQVALMLMLLPGVVSTLLFPRVSEAQDSSGALAARVTRHTAFVMLLVGALAVPAVFALPLLYGAGFADAVRQALLLLPGVILVSVGGVLAQHFSGTGLPVALPLIWVSALLFNVAVNLSVVPVYGARGAAVSSSVSYALVFALIALYFRARTGTPLRQAFLLHTSELRALFKMKHG